MTLSQSSPPQENHFSLFCMLIIVNCHHLEWIKDTQLLLEMPIYQLIFEMEEELVVGELLGGFLL